MISRVKLHIRENHVTEKGLLKSHVSQSQTHLFILLLLVFALLQRRLLKFLSVLQEQRVSQARAQEKIARLHGHHLVMKMTKMNAFILMSTVAGHIPEKT